MIEVNYIVYKSSTGEIVKTGICPLDLVESQHTVEGSPGETIMVGYANDNIHYVDVTTSPHSIVDKTSNPSSSNKTSINASGSPLEEAVISNIPYLSQIIIRGPTGRTSLVETEGDSQIEFSTQVVGIYNITIIHPEYLEKTITIEAVI